MAGDEVLGTLFDSVSEGLLVHDPETGAVLDANDRYCEMHGYSRAELQERSIDDLTAEDWTPPVEPTELVRRADEEGPLEFEWRNRAADGTAFWVEVRLSPVDYGGDRHVLASVHDISKRKERERQLRVLDRVLRHNLYNDMNVVRSRAELIKREAAGDLADTAEAIIEKVDDFIDTADKEREVVKLILEGGKTSRVDVTDCVRRRVERVTQVHPKASIETDLAPGATVVASAGFGRAIEELLENAIVHNDRATPRVSVTVSADEGGVTVEVGDDGPGIPDQEANILTGSREVAPLYHGSGLGLWLVNWVVQLSGGETAVEENDPRGAVVTVRQPAE